MRKQNVLLGITVVAVLILASALRAADTDYGQMWGIRSLVGKELRNAQGQAAGRLDEVVVHLHTGHAVYAIVSLGTKDEYAVPPGMIARGGVLKADKQKVLTAPKLTSSEASQLGNMSLMGQVYSHYGLKPWWSSSTRTNFVEVHRASHLMGMSVRSAEDQPVGKIENVTIDFLNGRVPFLLLAADQAKAGEVFPIPPTAFNESADKKHLVVEVNKVKIQSAPRVALNNLRQLEDTAFAAKVYQYYGKNVYWK